LRILGFSEEIVAGVPIHEEIVAGVPIHEEMKHLLLILVIFSFSCGSPRPRWYKRIIDERGEVKYIVVCGRTSQCYKRARWVCDGTYHIEDRSDREAGIAYSSNTRYRSNRWADRKETNASARVRRRIEWLIACDSVIGK